MTILIHEKLPNGVEVILKENHATKLCALQCWVGVGSLDEKENERGMSHLLEHMLFKGTKKRKVGEIAKTVEACGGDINAYTTFDRTVYYLTLTSNHVNTGIDLLADAVYNSAFDQTELEKEKEVVCEEIRRSLDNPASQVGRRLLYHAYRGSEAERPIIGYEDEVRGFSRDLIVSFHKKWYQPKNLSFVGVGDFNAEEILKELEKKFGTRTDELTETKREVLRESPDGTIVELLRGDYQQPRLEISFAAPGLEHEDTAPLDVAAFVLGSGDASRLTREIRDRLGFASAVGSSLYAPHFGGMFSLSAYPIIDHYLDTAKALGKEFANLKYANPMTMEEKERACANLRNDKIYNEETVSGMARSLGSGLTTTYKHAFEDVYLARIDEASPESVTHAVNKWLDENKAVIIGMVPDQSDLKEEEIKKAFLEGCAEGKKEAKAPIIHLRSDLKPTELNIANEVTAVYRRLPESKFFSVVATREGGLRHESDADVGAHYAMSDLVARASEDLTYDELLAKVEGLGATLEGFSGKDSMGLKVHCLVEHAGEMLSILKRCLFKPIFPVEQWQSTRREIDQQIKTQNDQPASVCLRRLQEIVFGDHPYRFPAYGTKESTKDFSEKTLLERFKRERDQKRWNLGCVGPLPLERANAFLQETFSSWTISTERSSQNKKYPQSEMKTEHVSKDREQTHIAMGFKGLTWSDSDRPVLDVISNILGGQGGRLFLNLRDQQSLAYTVAPLVSFGVDPGIFATYIACAPSKQRQAEDGLVKEIELICNELVSDDELSRAINYIVGSHEADLQRSEAQAMTMALMGLYGVGAEDFLTYPDKVLKVTKDDVKRVANRVLDLSKVAKVSVGHEN